MHFFFNNLPHNFTSGYFVRISFNLGFFMNGLLQNCLNIIFLPFIFRLQVTIQIENFLIFYFGSHKKIHTSQVEVHCLHLYCECCDIFQIYSKFKQF